MNVAPDHDEVLSCPPLLWFLVLFFGGSIGWALGFFYSVTASFVTFGLSVLLLSLGLWRYGSVRIKTTPQALWAGTQRLDWDFVGEPKVRGVLATRARLGAEADTRASLVIRPYIRTSVEIPVSDPEDPHPYWLVSSRHPDRLVTAINARRTADGD